MKKANPFFVVRSHGTDAHPFAAIVHESQLQQAVHDQLCVCRKAWATCETEDVVLLVKSMDYDDEWGIITEDGSRHEWQTSSPDGEYIEVTRLTVNPFSRVIDEMRRLEQDWKQTARQLKSVNAHPYNGQAALYEEHANAVSGALEVGFGCASPVGGVL